MSSEVTLSSELIRSNFRNPASQRQTQRSVASLLQQRLQQVRTRLNVIKTHTITFSYGGFKATYYQVPCMSSPNRDGATHAQSSSFARPVMIEPQTIFAVAPTQEAAVSTGLSHSITVVDPKMGSASGNTVHRVPCDLVVYDAYFELSSPGYPYTYPLNADCLYSVRRLNDRVCRLKLTFVEFDIESSAGCERDSLSVDSQKLCGVISNETTKEYEFNNYKMALRFRTDGFGTRKGFFIKGNQVSRRNFGSII